MRAKIRPILEECIELGIWQGYRKAHKHTDQPDESHVVDEIEHYIWTFIDERFDFDRSLVDEVVEGLDALKDQNK